GLVGLVQPLKSSALLVEPLLVEGQEELRCLRGGAGRNQRCTLSRLDGGLLKASSLIGWKQTPCSAICNHVDVSLGEAGHGLEVVIVVDQDGWLLGVADPHVPSRNDAVVDLDGLAGRGGSRLDLAWRLGCHRVEAPALGREPHTGRTDSVDDYLVHIVSLVRDRVLIPRGEVRELVLTEHPQVWV